MKHTLKLIARTGIMLSLAVIVAAACTPNQVNQERGEAFKQYETIV